MDMDRREGLQRIIAALREIVDDNGCCYSWSALMEIGNRIDLQDRTVRQYLKTLAALGVVAVDRARQPRDLTGMRQRARLRIQLLMPHAVIGYRDGYYYVVGDETGKKK